MNWYRLFNPKETPTHPLKRINDKRPEIMIVAVVKPTGEKQVQQIAHPPVETTKKQQK